ncbi:MAG TPA: hypothetical protein VIV06_03135, partial [Candidatus Limnocylindrales bacterium]
MSKPKAIAEAEARLRAVQAEIDTLEAKAAAIKAKEAPARKRLELLAKRGARAPLVIKRSDGVHVLPHGLADMRTSPYGVPLGPEAKRPDVVEAIANGAIAIDLSLSVINSVAGKAKGIAYRTRRPTPAMLRAIRQATAKRDHARKVLEAAEETLVGIRLSAFDSGTPVGVGEIAEAAADYFLAYRVIRSAQDTTGLGWSLQRAREEGLPMAQQHLAHAKSRSKEPCPCRRCAAERREAAWRAEAVKAAKEREREEAKKRRQIDRLPKREFTCPNSGEVNVSPVFTDEHTKTKYVECGDCEQAFDLRTIRSTPLGKAPGQATAFGAPVPE